jgi:polysaccharide pyruvyl transferase WcaK-like protein
LAHEAGLAGSEVVLAYQDAESFMRGVSRCRVFIGMKLHAVILAVAAGVASIAIEYRPKLADYMESIGALDSCVRIDALPTIDLAGFVASFAADSGHHAHRQWEGSRALSIRFGAYARELASSLHLDLPRTS